jgi:mono/diheme cytochrome c family protein
MRIRLLSALLSVLFAVPAWAIDAEDLRPGLVAQLRTGQTSITRIDPTPALTLNPTDAAHPRLSADAGTVTWTGYINLARAGAYQFQAQLRGQLRVRIGEQVVLSADAKDAVKSVSSGTVQLVAGVQPVEVSFTRVPGAARLELRWQGPGFRMEPLSSDWLGHTPEQAKPAFADTQIDYGRFLAEEHSCTKCHQPAADDSAGRALQARVGPNLSAVGGRVYAGWLERWLADPASVRPNTVMPKLFSTDATGQAEIYAVTQYLSSLGGPLQPAEKIPAPDQLVKSMNKGKELFTATGCIACHQTKPTASKPSADLSFHGLLAPTGPQANYALGAVGSKTRPEPLAAFLANPLAVNPSGRMPSLNLSTTEATDLARFLCGTVDKTIPREASAAPKPALLQSVLESLKLPADEQAKLGKQPAAQQWRSVGQKLLTTKGCVNCHTVAPGNKPLPAATTAPAWAKLAPGAKGCVSAQNSAHPSYAFTPEQQSALNAFLKEGRGGTGTVAPAFAARLALKRFNCLNCHQREGEGGMSVALVEELRKYEKPENSEQLVAPLLTGVGHKLRTPWLAQVLTQAGRSRPWMALRMPQYGPENVGHLATGLAHLEGADTDDSISKPKVPTATLTAGRQLVGKGGFGCISCHDISGIANTGTRGPDLATTNLRVRYDWYERWLEQPQRMAAGTKMPQVFPNGKSTLTEVLQGHAGQQSEAMWAYMALGPGLPLPDGLEPPKGLTVAISDRAEVLRTFLPEAGARGIAIGYPGGVSAAFDANAGRLVYAWSGNFLDTAPVWGNRGGAPAKLLGPTFWTSPPGQPWGLSTNGTPPDFATRAKDPAYGALPATSDTVFVGPSKVRLAGYTTDAKGYPTFRYTVRGEADAQLRIAERPSPLKGGVAVGLLRHFALEVPAQQTVWFRAGVSKRPLRVLAADGTSKDATVGLLPLTSAVLVPGDGERLTGLRASGPDGATWQIVNEGANWQVFVQLPAGAARAAEVSVQVWGIPRDEPALVQDLLTAR